MSNPIQLGHGGDKERRRELRKYARDLELQRRRKEREGEANRIWWERMPERDVAEAAKHAIWVGTETTLNPPGERP